MGLLYRGAGCCAGLAGGRPSNLCQPLLPEPGAVRVEGSPKRPQPLLVFGLLVRGAGVTVAELLPLGWPNCLQPPCDDGADDGADGCAGEMRAPWLKLRLAAGDDCRVKKR